MQMARSTQNRGELGAAIMSSRKLCTSLSFGIMGGVLGRGGCRDGIGRRQVAGSSVYRRRCRRWCRRGQKIMRNVAVDGGHDHFCARKWRQAALNANDGIAVAMALSGELCFLDQSIENDPLIR